MQTTSRRKLLRGIGGATLALPWLESLAKTPPQEKPPKRAAWFYVPIGVVRRGFFPGESEAAIPKFTGSRTEVVTDAELSVGLHDWQLTPTQEPLQRVKDKLTFITGLDRTFQEGTDVHAQCASCFLTSAAPHTVTQSPYPQARTFDHVIAETLGKNTPFALLNSAATAIRTIRSRYSSTTFRGMEQNTLHPACVILVRPTIDSSELKVCRPVAI